MVEVLAGFAIPQDKIALVLGIDRNTLAKHYMGELERGGALVEAQLGANLLRLSQGSDGTALKATMFALTTRFGWSQYVPRPPAEEPLGKKEQAQLDAETAHEGSDWSRLVN